MDEQEFLREWRSSPKGEYRDSGGYNVIVFCKRGLWRAWVKNRKTGWSVIVGHFNEIGEAKHAVFVEMLAHYAEAGTDREVVDLSRRRAAARKGAGVE
jgi:hypothetical protein